MTSLRTSAKALGVPAPQPRKASYEQPAAENPEGQDSPSASFLLGVRIVWHCPFPFGCLARRGGLREGRPKLDNLVVSVEPRRKNECGKGHFGLGQFGAREPAAGSTAQAADASRIVAADDARWRRRSATC